LQISNLGFYIPLPSPTVVWGAWLLCLQEAEAARCRIAGLDDEGIGDALSGFRKPQELLTKLPRQPQPHRIHSDNGEKAETDNSPTSQGEQGDRGFRPEQTSPASLLKELFSCSL